MMSLRPFGAPNTCADGRAPFAFRPCKAKLAAARFCRRQLRTLHSESSRVRALPAQARQHAHGTPADDDVWECWWCYDGWHPAADRLEAILPPWAVLRRMDPTRPLAEQVRNARVLIPTTGLVGAADIAAPADLRLVAQPAAGYNNIDVEAARRRGVPVTIAPGYNSASVAEVALMMMLMLTRRVDEARAHFAARGRIGEPVGRELAGKTLGIVGMGRVGSRLAAAARALGMEVLGVTSRSPRSELEALLAASHVVSLHCPLTPATRHLISHAELALMRPGAILLNCARGSVLDRDALAAALAAHPPGAAAAGGGGGGGLGGVGLDTHWAEPAPAADPLYADPRVLALPHLGSISAEVYERFAWILCENIVRAREGRELLHRLC